MVEVRSCTVTHHFVGLLRMSDYLTVEATTYAAQKKYNRRTSMNSVVFEPAILVVEGPQIYILDRMATGIGHVK
jgi:hypothetical protein